MRQIPKFLKLLSLAALLTVAQFGIENPASAAPCGGLNQRACPILKKGPRCKQFLRKSGKYCRPCGGLNQRVCPVVVGYRLCRAGLKIKLNTYVTPQHPVLKKAKQQYKKWKPTIQLIAASRKIISPRQIKALIKARNPRQFQRALESHPRVQLLYEALKSTGFRTLTVGLESSGSLGVGYARETGASLDTAQRHKPRFYWANSAYGGGIANVGNEIVLSAYTARNADIGGKALGAMGSFNVGSGVGVTIWYNPSDLYPIGFSINLGIGSIGAGGAVVSARTRVY